MREIRITNLTLNSTLRAALMIAALLALVYGQFLYNPPVFDDFYFFNGSTHDELFNGEAWKTLRWLPTASFAWVASVTQFDLPWQHVVNDLIHYANSLLLFIFLKQLFSLVLPQVSSIRHSQIALLAALLFSLHPASVYAVSYLIQRTILLMSFFALISMVAFLHGMQSRNVFWMAISVLAYFLSTRCKENGVALPAGLLTLAFLLERPSKSWFKLVLLPLFFMILIAVFTFIQVKSKHLYGQSYEVYATDLLNRLSAYDKDFNPALAYPLSILTQCALFFKYLAIWIIPGPDWLSVDMYEPFATRLTSLYYCAGAVAFALYGFTAIYLLCQRGVIGLFGWGMLWPATMFVTEFVTVRIQESFVIYRSYFWALGLFAVLPFVLQKINRINALTILIVILLVPLAWIRLDTFSHSVKLWDDAARLLNSEAARPGTERVYYNRGVAYAGLKMYDEAINDFDSALKINPQLTEAYTERGASYFANKNYQKAVSDFSTAISSGGNRAIKPRHYLAITLISIDRSDSALFQLDQNCVIGYQASCLLAKQTREKNK